MGGTSSKGGPPLGRIEPPALEFLFETFAIWDEPMDLGMTAAGHRLATPLREGRFEGPDIRGRLVPIASMLVELVQPDGITEVTAQIILETDDGHRILSNSFAVMWVSPDQVEALSEGQPYDPTAIYLRGCGRFSAAVDGPYAWLNRSLFIYASSREVEGSYTSMWRVL